MTSVVVDVALDNLLSKSVKTDDGRFDIYVFSIRKLCLSPAITNLDIVRKESFLDDTTLERTARKWVTSLTLSNGAPIRCDVVNGSSDKQTLLLVPRQHYAYAQAALREYRLRLNVLGERESRFRDSIPGLPTEILFDPSTQDNLHFIELLSSEEKLATSSRTRERPSSHPGFPT
jgi:hypothetical protein